MVADLDAVTLDEHLQRPGVALVSWHRADDAESTLMERALDAVSGEHPDVWFGAIDVARERTLARAWDVRQVPTLMVYRDGYLVFSRLGALPPAVIDSLLQAVWSLDMEEVRKGIDGQSARLALAVRGAGELAGALPSDRRPR